MTMYRIRMAFVLQSIALLLVAVVFLSACGGAGVATAPTSTAIPTKEIVTLPTSTPAPTSTATPEPTSTPAPTWTPLPRPTEAASDNRPGIGLFTSGPVAEEGSPAPDFELTLFDGDTVRLSELQGSVVVLNFWASWCPPCRWEMPDFEEMWQEYGDRDVVFVGVAISDFEENAKAFAEETGVTYPIGLDSTGVIARAYRPTSMPTTFFIDREGNVARRLVSVANKAMLKIFLQGQLKDG